MARVRMREKPGGVAQTAERHLVHAGVPAYLLSFPRHREVPSRVTSWVAGSNPVSPASGEVLREVTSSQKNRFARKGEPLRHFLAVRIVFLLVVDARPGGRVAVISSIRRDEYDDEFEYDDDDVR